MTNADLYIDGIWKSLYKRSWNYRNCYVLGRVLGNLGIQAFALSDMIGVAEPQNRFDTCFQI